MPYLQLLEAQFPLAVGETRVGRGVEADLRVPPGGALGDGADTSLVAIRVAADGSASLRVVQGDAGVFLNGVPVGREPAPLLHGDRLSIDGCELRFAVEDQAGITQELPTAGDARIATPSAGVGEARSRGRLVSLTDGREYAVPTDGLTIGRDAGCDIVVAAANVSRRHARIVQGPGGYELLDTSTNGVLVNGARVQGTLALARGDTVKVGNDEFRFYADAEPPAPPRSLEEVPSLQATAAIPAMKRPIVSPPPPPVSAPTPSVVPGQPTQGAPSAGSAEVPPAFSRRRPALAILEVLNEGPQKGKKFELASPLSHVGRGDHNDVVIHDESVSETHAKIQRREDAWYVVDMDSTNGTYVSGTRVFGESKVASGSDLRFGGVKMLFRTAGGSQRAEGETRVIVGVRGPDPTRAEQRLKELARGAETPQAPPTRKGVPVWLWLVFAAIAALFVYLVLQGR